MNTTRIPTIIAIIFLIVGLAAGVYLVQTQQSFRLGASPTQAPQDLRISNITDTSFVVSWYTDVNTAGFVNYGTTTNMNETAFESNSAPKRVHYIKVDQLQPETTYYFTINSGEDEYDNNNVPWSITTGPTIENTSNSLVINGQIFSTFETPAADIVVYTQIGGAQLISAKTSKNGNFVMTLSNVRNQSLDEYVSIDPRNTLIEIIVQGGPLGTAYVQTFAADAAPMRQIILGEAYDIRNQDNGNADDLPEARIELPDTVNESQFLID